MAVAIYFIFLISGVSGLVYQLIWVREFGQLFGNTVQSAALVSGTFVFGLGLGAYVAGRLIDKIHAAHSSAALLWYSCAEVGIAVAAFLLSVLIPHLESFSPLVSHYRVAADGWLELTGSSYLWRYVIATVLVGPVTILMGATLTLLIRFLLSGSVGHAGWRIGLLYGINTLGAALGCVLVDLWAVPHLGITTTNAIAVMLNLTCGVAAFGLTRVHRSAVAISRAVSPATLPDDALAILPLGLAIAISGFAAMGMEIAWFRFLSGVYMATRFTFSILLAVLLVGMFLGSTIAGSISKRFGNMAVVYVCGQLLFAVAVLGGVFVSIHTRRFYFAGQLMRLEAPAIPVSLFDYINVTAAALKTLFLPAVCMGLAYPSINAVVQKTLDKVGTRAGALYLWNCTGAIAGSLVTGFILLPHLGIQRCVTVLVMCAAVATVPALVSSWGTSRSWLVRGSVLAFGVMSVVWLTKPPSYLLAMAYDLYSMPYENILTVSEGINEIAAVSEEPEPTTGEGKVRRLITNGFSMSSTEYVALRYQRAFAHLPLLQMEHPSSVMILCFGVGNTLYAASLHPSVRHIEIVDLSKNVLGLAPYFSQWNRDILTDPRVSVIVNDGRQHLRMTPERSFDLISLEPPPLNHAGTAALYTEEFYRLAYRALKAGGYMTQWVPFNQVREENSRRLVKAFLDVFPNAVLLNGAYRDFILMGQKEGPNQIDWLSAERRLRSRSLVMESLREVNLAEPVDWLGTFVGSAPRLTTALSNVKPMTDDEPVIEYYSQEGFTKFPRDLFETGDLADWCPTCFHGGQLAADLSVLGQYLAVMQDIYHSKAFGNIYPTSDDHRPFFAIRMTRTPPRPEVGRFLRFPTAQEFKALLTRFPYLSRAFGPLFIRKYVN